MNAVQHSLCAKSAARGGVQRSLRHHRWLQRSMDLRALLRDKFTGVAVYLYHFYLYSRTKKQNEKDCLSSRSSAHNNQVYGLRTMKDCQIWATHNEVLNA